ncbi:MAG: hypothetical protein ACUVWJ_00380 [Spirochaetota bacterium]
MHPSGVVLKRCGCDGWYILDIYPYRIDGLEALKQGVDRARFFIELSGRIDSQDFRDELYRADVIATGKRLGKIILGA